MLFDFKLFLSKIDPSHKYETQTLTGGLVNVTIRATKTSASSGGFFPKHSTLVLKYAPPFVAALGESAPFSQERQSVEARALALFSPPRGPLFNLAQSSSVAVPKLLYHSPEEHVLVLEDLGPLLTLPQYISAIPDEQTDGPALVEETCERLGSRIGEFFGQLHSPNSRELARTAISGNLENRLTKDLVLQEVVLPIEKHLTRFNIPNAQVLFRRVLENYQRASIPDEECFVLGDFTPGAILIPASSDGPMGVIDWEFSGLGRGPNGDMTQFLAALNLHLISTSPGSQRRRALNSLIRAICSAYHQHSSKWLKKLYLCEYNASNNPRAGLRARSESLQIFRSALILLGREMINNAVEQEWNDLPHKEKSFLVQEMVERGSWYLEMAGDDVEGMLDAANLEKLLKEDERVMLGLFGIEH